MKHCNTCTCGSPLPISDFRARQKKLYRGVPDVGCLYHRAADGYCGLVTVDGGDYCKEHN